MKVICKVICPVVMQESSHGETKFDLVKVLKDIIFLRLKYLNISKVISEIEPDEIALDRFPSAPTKKSVPKYQLLLL